MKTNKVLEEQSKKSFSYRNQKKTQTSLTGWMRVAPLRRKLELLGWKPYQKVLTPEQVACIIEYVGELNLNLTNKLNYYYV